MAPTDIQNVDSASIEKCLADLWRVEGDSPDGLTRAALWNVVAHTADDADRNRATEVLSSASASVPQRSIIIRAALGEAAALTSWISANCHLTTGRKQMCSEQISIAASGERVHGIPSLVNALLIPDMPVAAWWLGDLPQEEEEYIRSLLDPADRLIVDSIAFDSVEDLGIVHAFAREARALPADLNWMRLEEWRVATASVFDAPVMRPLLQAIARVRIDCALGPAAPFGQSVQGWYYAAWLAEQTKVAGREELHVEIVPQPAAGEGGMLLHVEIEFDDGSSVTIERKDDLAALVATVTGVATAQTTVTRAMPREVSDLVVRQLSHRDEDRLFARLLPSAMNLVRRQR